MKQPKKLTLTQKKIISECGLNPADWMCQLEDKLYLHVVKKGTGKLIIVDKTTKEIVETRINHKMPL